MYKCVGAYFSSFALGSYTVNITSLLTKYRPISASAELQRLKNAYQDLDPGFEKLLILSIYIPHNHAGDCQAATNLTHRITLSRSHRLRSTKKTILYNISQCHRIQECKHFFLIVLGLIYKLKNL